MRSKCIYREDLTVSEVFAVCFLKSEDWVRFDLEFVVLIYYSLDVFDYFKTVLDRVTKETQE